MKGGLVCCVVAVSALACAGDQGSPTIVYQRDAAATLTSQLPPGLGPVVVIPNGHIDFPTPTGSVQEQLADDVKYSDGIVILTVRHVGGFLVRRETWIDTRVTGQVEQILKMPEYRSIAGGDTFEMEHRGGQMSLWGRSITTKPGPLFKVGRTYLVFFGRYTGGRIMPRGSWRIREDGTLGALLEEEKHPNQLGGMTIDQIVDEIHAILKR